jgi:hypothetical protein
MFSFGQKIRGLKSVSKAIVESPVDSKGKAERRRNQKKNRAQKKASAKRANQS